MPLGWGLADKEIWEVEYEAGQYTCLGGEEK